ncbi:MAG: hypothetical protein K2G89_00340 [Lachnospiraceae bacterium]|nr:hypothetical protein [Lachnospiraceae bacterium]
MMIAVTALKEKIRKKVLYIVSILGGLILALFGTGTGSISIDGTPVTDYKILAPILLAILNVISCVMAVVLSLDTIPNEYERKTSHLVLIRNVSQTKYHAALTIANIMAGLLAELILFAVFLLFMISQHQGGDIWRLVPAFFISAICVVLICVMTSWLSIFLPRFFAGTLSVIIVLAGVFYNMLELLNSIVGGFAGKLLKGILYIVPDLHGIQQQAGSVLTDGTIEVHLLLKGLLWIYIFAMLLGLFKRKEV